jgi:hypothetical protein
MKDPVARCSKSEALLLLRECLEFGEVIPSKHFRDELAAEDLTLPDAMFVISHGGIYDEPELDIRYGEWTYRVEGTEPGGKYVAIVFSFKSAETTLLITVFSITTR